MTTEEKIRWLAEQAGSCVVCDKPDYEHSFDAIARDLLPLLREKGLALTLHCTPEAIQAWITNSLGQTLVGAASADSPATAAFEAIFEALHGETE